MIMKPYLFRHNDKVICAEPKRRSGGGGRKKLQFCWVVSPEAAAARAPRLLLCVVGQRGRAQHQGVGVLSSALQGMGREKRAVLTQQ